jgi:hypothetical protein
VVVASADVICQRLDVGHHRQIGDVTVDPPSATGRRGCLNDRPDALGLASHEYNFGPSPREFDRSGSPDAASRPSEHNDGHRAGRTCGRGTGTLQNRRPIDFPTS